MQYFFERENTILYLQKGYASPFKFSKMEELKEPSSDGWIFDTNRYTSWPNQIPKA